MHGELLKQFVRFFLAILGQWAREHKVYHCINVGHYATRRYRGVCFNAGAEGVDTRGGSLREELAISDICASRTW